LIVVFSITSAVCVFSFQHISHAIIVLVKVGLIKS